MLDTGAVTDYWVIGLSSWLNRLSLEIGLSIIHLLFYFIFCKSVGRTGLTNKNMRNSRELIIGKVRTAKKFFYLLKKLFFSSLFFVGAPVRTNWTLGKVN